MASEDDIVGIAALSEGDDQGSGNRRLLGVIALVAIIFMALWLFLSQTANVPDVIGLQESEALLVIADAGFVVGKIDTIAAEAPAGEVTAQAPAGGARALAGAQIDLTVAMAPGDESAGGDVGSSGPSESGNTFDPDYIPPDSTNTGDGSSGGAIAYGPQVPQVLGMSEAKALSTLKAAGYAPVVGGRGPSTTTVAAGLVYYQDPPPEAFAARGKTVEIWISTGSLTHGIPYEEPE
ncbi:MAG: PASTA domain-containing protein [Coriobacteriia bacterium]|nr:PASTA domain-containing protein [Coriobacteriia bacterium]